MLLAWLRFAFADDGPDALLVGHCATPHEPARTRVPDHPSTGNEEITPWLKAIGLRM
jgi:hypothetical protein